MTQLDLFTPKKPTSRKACHLARQMIAVLAVNKGWVTRREFHERHGFSKDGRECRAGRAAANGRIIRSQLGYKLVRHATEDEIRSGLNAWTRQIEAEQKEYSKQLKRAHAALHKRGLL